MAMGTGASDTSQRGPRDRNRRTSSLRGIRRARARRIELEGLESRTLLATIPAATATGGAVELTGLFDVTKSGNANSPSVVVDPYNPQKLFAVWGVDRSSITPTVPHTTAVVEGAFSNNGGASWTSLGEGVAPVQLDVATINANPSTSYTQVTDPSVGFDGQDNVYVLSLQSSGANDGELYLTKFNFSGGSPVQQFLPNGGNVYQWVTGSDAVTSPVLAVDTAPPFGTATPDPHANNVYIAWASIDTEPANTNPFTGPGFNPNRAELVVGTPHASGGEESLAFSGVQTLNVGGNFGPQDNSHPQLVINQNDGGQVTVAWDDFGSGAKATPPFDSLMSSLVQPGDSYGFAGQTGTVAASASPPVSTSFTDQVAIPSSAIAALDDLTVTVGLVDQQSVQNLSVVLQAPGGQQLTLFQNQINAAGTTNANVGLPSGNAVGVFGFGTGTTGTQGIQVGTTFDDNATRGIFDPTTTGTNGNSAAGSGYIGYFRPEGGSLREFLASLGGNVNGPWTLLVNNFTKTVATGVPDQGEVRDFSLQFSTGMGSSGPHGIASTVVTGALGNTFARAVPASPTGVGPGLVLAVDNSLGSGSPYQGRIYAAYVDYIKTKDIDGHINPPENTDIYLAYSTDGGLTWNGLGRLNTDNADADGHSAAGFTSGRTQFQPALAVDPATGTLVASWRDARDDAANARVATYIASSIDGGQSFSAQTYANPPQTAIDAITGKTDIMGPQADNQSSGNAQRDGTFGYGNQMGLAVFDGHVYPVWAGNLNQATVNGSGTVIGNPLNIWYRPMAIAAGPRIISSTMGPIPLAEAESRSVSISVTFDRPITASTFVPGDVQVSYRDTKGDPAVPLKVTGITGGGSQYTITFDPLPAGANPATYNYTGAYSYLIAPDNGVGLAISSPIWSFVGTTFRPYDPMDQNADGTPDQKPGDVYAVPAPATGNASLLVAPFDQNTLPLIVPGPQVLSTSVPGGNSGAGNLVTDGTVSTFNVTFDRPMKVSSFTPAQVLQIMGPTGSLLEPQTFASGPVAQAIQAAASPTSPSILNSTLTVPLDNNTFKVGTITVRLDATFSADSALSAVLVSPGGISIPLFPGGKLTGANFTGTVFDEAAEASILAGTAPFTGSFQPSNAAGFSPLSGAAAEGNWTLVLTNTGTGASGTLNDWSLSITPAVTVTALNPATQQPTTASTTTLFQIGFPQQQLSGTYTIQLGPNILDTFGEGLDTNQNAGLVVLRGQDQSGPTTTVHYSAGDLPKAIPAPTGTTPGQTTPGQVTSTIAVPDSFVIAGDRTQAGASVMQVQISLTYPTDSDLTATLTHNGKVVTLFSGVGARSAVSTTRSSTITRRPRSSRAARLSSRRSAPRSRWPPCSHPCPTG
jgi:subtilisin-like proprotein convertase family protein